MRILHVAATLSAEWGGPPKAAIEMTRALAQRGHSVALYAADDGGETVPLEPALSAGVDVRRFPVRFPRFWKRAPGLVPALRDALQSADIVHLHSLYLYHDWVTGVLCRRFDVPYILRPHGTLDPYLYRRHRWRKLLVERLFQNRVTRGAAVLHFTAEEEQELARPYCFGVPGAVVPLGLHMGEYDNLPDRCEFRARHPEIGDRRILLFFGRLSFKKGLDILVPAFAQACRARDDLHLVFAGPDYDMADKVRGWLAEEGLALRATFTGMLKGRDKLAVLAGSDLFVLPSYTENFGISVIEAMACGLPVLISDRVNIWREVKADGAGFVEPCDVNRFASALLDLLSDDDRLIKMGEAGRKSVRARYDWAHIGAELERLYQGIVAR